MTFDSYRGQKVLVTGHTGFKGSWLSLWLKKLGADVIGYALPPATNPSLFDCLELRPKISHHEGDVRDFDKLRAVIRECRPDVIFHLAAEAIVRDCYDHPKTAFDVNIGGTVNVLEAVRELGTTERIIVVTSDKCYENLEAKVAFRESDRLGGSDPYSSSKAGAELVVHTYARSYFSRSSTTLASARAGNVIGGGDWANHRLLPDCVRALEKGETLRIRSPDAVRPWQHVLESLNGYLLLGERLATEPDAHRGEAYNFGPDSDQHRTVQELLETAKQHWNGLNWMVESGMIGTKKEASYLQLDCSKAKERLRWRPRLSFDTSLAWTTQWYITYLEDPGRVLELTSRQIDQFTNQATP